MKAPDMDKLRESGRISATARLAGAAMVEPGAKLEAIALRMEEVIRDMGGEPAFPAQVSCNHIAAHYCSPPGDPLTVQPNDIVKVDCGVHVDGWVTDNAMTVDLQGGEASALVAASRMALENAISVMGPGASITEVGRQIESTIKALGYTPVYNLTGHGVARHTIHCAPSIPNYPDPKAAKLKPGQTIACEPFACDGRGSIDVQGKAEVFGLKRRLRPKDKLPAELAQAVENLGNLPFARRSLMRAIGDGATVQDADVALKTLDKLKLLEKYPPLVEQQGVRVAQTEHTVFIHEDRAEVLTYDP